MERVISLLIGYIFGMFQTSYFYGKSKGIDIRKTGSGNAGTTNALRTLGLKAGLITMGCDIGKCILAVIVTWLIFRGSHPDTVPLIKIWTAAGVILGHDFPFYLNFKGGKGIAATAGMIISFGDLRLIGIGIVVFFGLFFLTHYVSIGSLCLSLEFLIGIIAFGQHGSYGMTQPHLTEMYVIVIALTALAFYGHRGNVSRLIHGNERKTYLSKSKKF